MQETETQTTFWTTSPTTSLSSGLDSPNILVLIQILRLFRVLQLLSTCVAFSMEASTGTWIGGIGSWSLFIWCFCFVVTLIILIVEFCELQSRIPFYWYNFPINYACHAALFCLLASIIYSTTYVHLLPPGPTRDQAITASAFSCIAAVVYVTEVVWIWACNLPGEFTGFTTVPMLLKGLENLVACVIFAFISSPYLYQHQPALVWCVAVYAICFLLDIVALLQGLVDCDNRLPFFSILLLVMNLLSVLLYASALVLWPLYQFEEKLGGQPQRSSDAGCRDEVTYLMCTWDQRLAVAVLTAINLLIYVADLVYWSRVVFVIIKDLPQGS
ncbi:myeloid-associated differentiation marker-like [Phacochoerus africanus]|uniref:myeloid-associated differentiation marker-like n=1 Tax=Phacochoerus africanus TaxID=41426 RepID=UPI001FD9E3A3|nr:myeloid-associated differentiation marker-like [Phacochoerus africanus]